jgi:signal peptidase I
MPSWDMFPNFSHGDIVEYENISDSLSYGDIIVFNFNGREKFIPFASPAVLRVVGLPGDHFAIENNFCIINEKKNATKLINIDTTYISENKWIEIKYEEIFPNGVNIKITLYDMKDNTDLKTITIPDNHYFVMGDNRSYTYDSRYIGVIHKEQIIGKVSKITHQDR